MWSILPDSDLIGGEDLVVTQSSFFSIIPLGLPADIEYHHSDEDDQKCQSDFGMA
jgi:hypothetical protein